MSWTTMWALNHCPFCCSLLHWLSSMMASNAAIGSKHGAFQLSVFQWKPCHCCPLSCVYHEQRCIEWCMENSFIQCAWINIPTALGTKLTIKNTFPCSKLLIFPMEHPELLMMLQWKSLEAYYMGSITKIAFLHVLIPILICDFIQQHSVDITFTW